MTLLNPGGIDAQFSRFWCTGAAEYSKAQRYIDYEPADDLADETADENPTMYCETIDAAKGLAEATVLSKDANDIVKVARQTQENIERILNGPKNNSFEKILTCTVLLIRSIIRHHNRPTGVLLDAAIQQS